MREPWELQQLAAQQEARYQARERYSREQVDRDKGNGDQMKAAMDHSGMAHELKKGERWQRHGHLDEACQSMVKVIHQSPWLEEARCAQRKWVDLYNIQMHEAKKQAEQETKQTEQRGMEQPVLAGAGQRQQARMQARGKAGGGAAGGIGRHHRAKGQGLMAPIDLPVQKKALDAQLAIKRAEAEAAAVAELAQSEIDKKWHKAELLRNAYRDAVRQVNDPLLQRASMEANLRDKAANRFASRSSARPASAWEPARAQPDRSTQPPWADEELASHRRHAAPRSSSARVSKPFASLEDDPVHQYVSRRQVQEKQQRHTARMRGAAEQKQARAAQRHSVELAKARSPGPAANLPHQRQTSQCAHQERMSGARVTVPKSNWAAPRTREASRLRYDF
eukprot:jgi/Tetstr1/463093/TSEL_008027.t1